MTTPLTLVLGHRDVSVFLLEDGTELVFTALGTSIRSKLQGWASDPSGPPVTLKSFIECDGEALEALAARFLVPDWSEANAKGHLEYLIRLATEHGWSEVAADLAHQLETEEPYEGLTDWFGTVVPIAQRFLEDGVLTQDEILPDPGFNAEEFATFKAAFDLFRAHFQRRFVLTDEGPKARMVMV
jgi:hypothetical protein